MNSNPILIIAGEPFSIFSEILVKTLRKKKFKKPLVLIASLNLIKDQTKFFGYNVPINIINQDFKKSDLKKNKINLINVDFKYKKFFTKITNLSYNYNKKCFELALKLIKKKKFSGLINGPISKKNFLKKNDLGITEFLARKTNTKKFAMLIFNRKLGVCPVTTHVPLKKVSSLISKKKIIDNVHLIKKFYKKYFKKDPKIAITGLNPHCESNFRDSEEKNIIKPAIKSLQKLYYNISGPHPADSLFIKNNVKNFDVVVGMFHDQVLTPLKSLHNFDAINITLGLPFLRISPDHGTNNQMLGKNLSNPESLIESIKFLDQR
tara:strand:- start:954 stop:1916 length:963 start_codon:yes stop_codon:yes gene_type:complete